VSKLTALAEGQLRDPANIVTRRTNCRLLRPNGRLTLCGKVMDRRLGEATTTKITRPSSA